MLRWLVMGVAALLVLSGAWSSAVLAQTPSPSGAYASLSPGNQNIARALFEAQQTSSGGTTINKPLTLDQIAAKKQSGQGWGKVFKDMKAQGLVQEKNLGQVVSRYHRARNGHVVTASGREFHDGRDGYFSGGHRDDGGSEKRGYGKAEGKYEAAGAAGGGSGPGSRGSK